MPNITQIQAYYIVYKYAVDMISQLEFSKKSFYIFAVLLVSFVEEQNKKTTLEYAQQPTASLLSKCFQ